MSSKREEERNEKIIRGLMKLPPNRRCINCNSLGPQYVCINFWTFVCITCSGIHREFTHRVKSVSMSKFTSQEVESLQNGGNQRAKELFLKDWDFERQRLPSGNNIEKIREFIKNVYVDRKYAGGKSSEKPPRDVQSHWKNEAETRRASSYHSYSQSPPYDFQYEERRNRKQGVMLTRKLGSDRGLYEDKVSGLYSPGRYSDHMTEERFTIERSSSRVSDYSLSSGGDPFRSHPQSPNSPKDSGFNSPSFVYSKESRADDIQHQTGITNNEGVTVTNAQRVGSSTTDGDSSKASLNSANFASFADFSQLDQPSVASHQNKIATVPSFSQSFAPVNTSTVDLFKEQEPHEKHPVNPVSSIDLFQSPAMPSVVDFFQMISDSPASTGNVVSSHTSLSSLSFFEESSQNFTDTDLLGAAHSGPAPNNLVSSHTSSLSSLSFLKEFPQNSSAINMGAAHSESATNNSVSSHTPSLSPLSFFEEISQDSSATNVGVAHSDSVPNDVGWANFDFPQHASTSKNHDFADVAEHSGTAASIGNVSSPSTSHASTQWPEFLSSTGHGAPPLMSNLQHEILPNNPASAIASNSQEWRPFDDIDKQQGRGVTVLSDKPSTSDHFMDSIESEDFYRGRSQSTTSFGPVPGLPLHVIDESLPINQSAATFMVEPHSHFEHNTSNPFDVDLGASNMFYDMSTLHAALPSTDLPSSFAGAMNDSWFLHEAANPGGISYMATQAQSSQLPNDQTHGPVASVGGNPFA